MPPPCGQFFSVTLGLQRVAYGIMVDELFPVGAEGGLAALVERRVRKMFSPFELDAAVNFAASVESLRQHHPSDAAKVLKTWLNGWITTSRMHTPHLHPCLLGCGGETTDSLAHYVQCPWLYALLKFFIPETSADPLRRLG